MEVPIIIDKHLNFVLQCWSTTIYSQMGALKVTKTLDQKQKGKTIGTISSLSCPTFSFSVNFFLEKRATLFCLSAENDEDELKGKGGRGESEWEMEKTEEELERRSKFLNSLILKKKSVEEKVQNEHLNVHVRASDMSISLQNHAFKCARHNLDATMACGKLDSKSLALALKKEFDSTYGPAWHCIVGTSFGSYVTHSIGGFLYFSIDKLYLQGCASLTIEGVISAIKLLTKPDHRLKNLAISGIYNVKIEDFHTLCHLMGINQMQIKERKKNYSHKRHELYAFKQEFQPSIDVDICPKCGEIREVFDCPRDSCKRRMQQQHKQLLIECRGCFLCVTRCEECGVCTKDEELGEAVCADILCLNCWLHLPKCNFCNKAYCNQHAHHQHVGSSSGFLCSDCSFHAKQSSYWWF